MEFEFDERTLYGEDQISSLGNVPREVCDDMDSAADSDNDESTEIDIGMSSRGSCGQSSLEGHSFAPIPGKHTSSALNSSYGSPACFRDCLLILVLSLRV